MLFESYFSQLRQVRERKAKKLHPVSELKRFYILVCCYFCSVVVSVVYAFDLFATEFSREFGLSGGDLSTVSTVGLVFCYFTIPYSLIFEKLGPFVIFMICFVTSFIGGLCLALVFQKKVTGSTVTIAIFYAFLNTTSGLIDTAYISTLVEIFPRNRGPVVAMAKVMTSLGGSLLSVLSDTVFKGSVTSFIIFIMILAMVVSAWAAFTVVLPPYMMNWWRLRHKTPEEIEELESTAVYYERKFVPLPRLAIGYGVVISLIIFFTVEAPVVAYTGAISHGTEMAIGIIAIVLTLCAFLMLLPIPALGGMHEPMPQAAEEEEVVAALPQDSEPATGKAKEAVMARGFHDEDASSSCEHGYADEHMGGPNTQVGPSEPLEAPHAKAEEESPQDPRYQGTFFDYLRGLDLWLIMLLFICYGCMGILVMYNASTISIAMSGKERDQSTSVLYTSFLGVGSAVGRIAFGLFEAYVQHQTPGQRRFLITFALPFSPAMAFLGGLLILVIPSGAILFPYILIYVEEGVFAGINALIFPCLFERHHNALYNLSFLVQCIGIICFNRLMFGVYVDNQTRKLGTSDTGGAERECRVAKCVQIPLIVGTCLGFVGVFVALLIHIRYKRFVSRFWANRRWEEEQDANEAAHRMRDLDEVGPQATSEVAQTL